MLALRHFANGRSINLMGRGVATADISPNSMDLQAAWDCAGRRFPDIRVDHAAHESYNSVAPCERLQPSDAFSHVAEA
jgi:hypothetical protein